MTTDGQAWDRQPEESAKAYTAFVAYMEMGEARSIAKVAQKLSKSIPLLKRWSREWRWADRCREYDIYTAQTKRKAAEAELQEMNRRNIELARKALDKAEEALNQLDPGKLKPSDIVRYIQVAADIEKAARLLDLETYKEHNTEEEKPPTLAELIQAAYSTRSEGG